MLLKLVVVTLGCILLLPPQKGYAEESFESLRFGTVIRTDNCQNKFFVVTKNGYSMLERTGGAEVLQLDLIEGDLEKIGPATVINKSRNASTNVFVEQSLLERNDVRRLADRYCH